MTRTTDTLINLVHRAPRYCRADCDLFVSIHVNALDVAPGYTLTRGFETYFLGAAKAADAARTARMENEAVRFEAPDPAGSSGDKLDFMFKDLQANAFLRASARAAGLVQSRLAGVHQGTNRGVKQADFAVLTTARSPAILVELGFSTNTEDAQLMTTRATQLTLARAIAQAIETFLNETDAQTTSSQEEP